MTSTANCYKCGATDHKASNRNCPRPRKHTAATTTITAAPSRSSPLNSPGSKFIKQAREADDTRFWYYVSESEGDDIDTTGEDSETKMHRKRALLLQDRPGMEVRRSKIKMMEKLGIARRVDNAGLPGILNNNNNNNNNNAPRVEKINNSTRLLDSPRAENPNNGHRRDASKARAPETPKKSHAAQTLKAKVYAAKTPKARIFTSPKKVRAEEAHRPRIPEHQIRAHAPASAKRGVAKSMVRKKPRPTFIAESALPSLSPIPEAATRLKRNIYDVVDAGGGKKLKTGHNTEKRICEAVNSDKRKTVAVGTEKLKLEATVTVKKVDVAPGAGKRKIIATADKQVLDTALSKGKTKTADPETPQAPQKTIRKSIPLVSQKIPEADDYDSSSSLTSIASSDSDKSRYSKKKNKAGKGKPTFKDNYVSLKKLENTFQGIEVTQEYLDFVDLPENDPFKQQNWEHLEFNYMGARNTIGGDGRVRYQRSVQGWRENRSTGSGLGHKFP